MVKVYFSVLLFIKFFFSLVENIQKVKLNDKKKIKEFLSLLFSYIYFFFFFCKLGTFNSSEEANKIFHYYRMHNTKFPLVKKNSIKTLDINLFGENFFCGDIWLLAIIVKSY